MAETIHYTDPVEKCRGYLVYDDDQCRIAAGGCRVQRGLSLDTLQALAARMTLKQRLLGLSVDGAKCGIDLDPRSRVKGAVLRRFLVFLRKHLDTRLSMGCDMGTGWHELESIARSEGLLSVKQIIQREQGLSQDDFLARLRLLDQRTGFLTLGQLRAGHALAHATIEAAKRQGVSPSDLTVGLQGFGNMGRAAAQSLVEQGATLVAIADEYGCLVDPRGLDVLRMLATAPRIPLTEANIHGPNHPSNTLLTTPVHVLILAATENALSPAQAATVSASLVVVGANNGIGTDAERELYARSIPVLPDFVAGAGGPISMNALFGNEELPTTAQLLADIAEHAQAIVAGTMSRARDENVTLSEAAMRIARSANVSRDRPPYGTRSYLSAIASPAGTGPRDVASS